MTVLPMLLFRILSFCFFTDQTAFWYSTDAVRITSVKAALRGDPHVFYTLCQKKDASRLERTYSFHPVRCLTVPVLNASL